MTWALVRFATTSSHEDIVVCEFIIAVSRNLNFALIDQFQDLPERFTLHHNDASPIHLGMYL